MKERDFRDKVAIITGASGSLGQELALGLARRGARLTLAARGNGRLEAVAEKCKELGAKVIVVPTDVSQEDNCRQLISMTVKQYGKIDLLVNNAAVTVKKSFQELDDLKSFVLLIETNFFGCVYCTRYALPYLKKTNGRILGICSILGKIATPGNTAYCSSKFAMSAFFDSLRYEIAGDNVSITMVYPGYLAEKMNSSKERQSGIWKKITSLLKVKANVCAEISLNAAAKRKRQVILPFYSVLSLWISLLFPGLFDRIISIVGKIREPV
ncbi:SDR family oxidoreductase [Candidatus Saganbacteria bacterium]|nr:SDR family oxidoreductase [Candidatus Saganbacteria bacterium]